MEGKKVIRIVNNKPRAFFFTEGADGATIVSGKQGAVFWDNSLFIPDDLGI